MIQPKLDRTDPAKSAASKSAIQYRSDTDSDLPWTMRKYTPISKRKCKTLHKWCGAHNSAVSSWHWLLSAVRSRAMFSNKILFVLPFNRSNNKCCSIILANVLYLLQYSLQALKAGHVTN